MVGFILEVSSSSHMAGFTRNYYSVVTILILISESDLIEFSMASARNSTFSFPALGTEINSFRLLKLLPSSDIVTIIGITWIEINWGLFKKYELSVCLGGRK
jgi:hypothetical protein